jgi:ribosomal protein S27E
MAGELGQRPLGPDERYRCAGCGNVTRFDVVETTRTRRYLHLDLSGAGRIDEEEVLAHALESVTCRWCGRDDTVRIEPRPRAES